MKVQYDQEADALYVTLGDGEIVDRTIRIDAGTLVDVDRRGRPMGIEIIHPARPWPLEDILERFQVRDEDRRLLEELQGIKGASEEPHRRPFVEPVQLVSA
jgi:uncharacterized protein YuzE